MMSQSNRNNVLTTYLDKYALITVFAIMILIFSLISQSFFTLSNLINILVQASAMGIATVGAAMVILQGGVDLSAGSCMFLSMVVCSRFFNMNLGLVPLVLISVATGALLGCLNGLFVAYIKVIPFITTLGTMTLGRGLGLTISEAKIVIFSDASATVLRNARVLGIPVIVLVLAAILVLAQVVLTNTGFGRQLYAIGNNQLAAVKIGINVKRRRFHVYILSGAFSGLSGFIFSAQSGSISPDFGKGQEFIFISAAVLGGVSLFGGKGKIFPGVLLGILIITVIENGLVIVGANPYAYQIVRGLIILFAVVIDCIKYKGDLR